MDNTTRSTRACVRVITRGPGRKPGASSYMPKRLSLSFNESLCVRVSARTLDDDTRMLLQPLVIYATAATAERNCSTEITDLEGTNGNSCLHMTSFHIETH